MVTTCTAEYPPPDLFLGHERFNQTLDMWSLGCVTAELFLRDILFCPNVQSPRGYLESHLSFLGPPARKT